MQKVKIFSGHPDIVADNISEFLSENTITITNIVQSLLDKNLIAITIFYIV